MLAYTYVERGKFELQEKQKPALQDDRDAIIRVTLASICTSDLHIKHGSVPRAVPGVTVGHEMVGVVEAVGPAVAAVKPRDRVAVNVETFCGECFFCKHGYVNNCTDPNGGWALGCRIDGGQAEYVRVPYADNGLTRIPDGVTDRQALFTGDILSTGFWAAQLGEIREGDTVAVLGAGPTGLCTMMCARLYRPACIITVEPDPAQRHRGGGCYVRREQSLPLPEMYGKNLTFKTGGVDACRCGEILGLIAAGQLDTEPLITHTYPLADVMEAYRLFEAKEDGVLKVAVRP